MKLFKNKSKDNKGFTTLELLIVITLISLIAVSIIPLFSKAITTNHASRNKLYAYQAAHSEIEKIRSEDFNTLNGYNFTVSGMPHATGSVEIDQNVDGVIRSDIVKATAIVTWEFAGKPEEVKLATYLSSKGLE